jgi:tRNA (cytidine/uridine-2'-O-)-methyltransferase
MPRATASLTQPRMSSTRACDDGRARALEPARLHVVLVEPEIAANTGSIGRTCVAAAAKLWLVRPLGFRLSDRHLRRAGLDYWPHLDHQVVETFDDVVWALGRDRLWLFSTKAAASYTSAAFRAGDALVFGPESRGLPRSWLTAHPERALRIPMNPIARSLNLANAVSVAVFEAMRQIGIAEFMSPTPPATEPGPAS